MAALGAALGCAGRQEWTTLPAPACHVVGRVLLRGGDAPLGRAVVFLEPIDAAPATKALAPVVIRQRVGRFDPDFAVAAVGQPVRFRNDDEIFHGVFSYSPPNPFERQPYPPGESRTVTFRHAGVVVTYSPLHTGMRGVILVVPGSHHAVPNALGVFQIGSVPAGRYRLSLWTERQGGASREISLAPGEVARADLTLAPKS